MQHSQLASAVENLQNIFSEQAKLLEGHHKLMEPGVSWNDHMYEQYRMDSKNTHSINLILNYFGKVQGLSDDLAKQLWIERIKGNQMVTRESDKMWLKESQN
ncbi:unnamed protein product [Coregonus sp. 'balchen']|nr:unnamed protein product [Coregonus sp. 'balchen']